MTLQDAGDAPDPSHRPIWPTWGVMTKETRCRLCRARFAALWPRAFRGAEGVALYLQVRGVVVPSRGRWRCGEVGTCRWRRRRAAAARQLAMPWA